MSDFCLIGDNIELSNYGILSGSTDSIAVTANASANTLGSFAQIVASTGDDINGFWLTICSDTISVNSDYLLNLAIGSASNEEIIVPNILYSLSGGSDLDFLKKLFIPIEIPAGTRISAQIQSTTGSNVARVSIMAAPPFFTSPVMGQEVISIGENTGDSGGTQVDPGGTANTKGSYVQMTASLSDDIRAIMVLQGQQANTNQRNNRVHFDLAIGAGGSEEILIPDMVTRVSATEILNGMNDFVPIAIPAGTRIAIRSASSDNNSPDRLLDYVIYGLR